MAQQESFKKNSWEEINALAESVLGKKCQYTDICPLAQEAIRRGNQFSCGLSKDPQKRACVTAAMSNS